MASSASLTTTVDPLTTIFTPPSWCNGMLYTYFAENNGLSTYWRDKNGPGDGTKSACFPENVHEHHDIAVPGQYSPGVCPSGYVPAITEQGTDEAQTSYCCPSSFTLKEVGGGCVSTVTTATVVAKDDFTNVSTSGPWVAGDWYIKVVWATSDLDLFTPKSAPLQRIASRTGKSSSAGASGRKGSSLQPPRSSPLPIYAPQTSAPVASSDSTGPTHATTTPGISTGVKAGIGVGAAVAGIVIIVLVLLVLRYRRQNQHRNMNRMSQEKLGAMQLDSDPIYEASGIPRAELDGS